MDDTKETFSPDEVAAFEDMINKTATDISDKEMTPWVFANDKNNPAPFGVLNMFYQGVFSNTLGVMVAKEVATGKERMILVGLAKDDKGEMQCYPVAVCLGQENTRDFLPPDGLGNYVDFPTAE